MKNLTDSVKQLNEDLTRGNYTSPLVATKFPAKFFYQSIVNMNQPVIYTAVAKGSQIEVLNANNGVRLYTLSIGSNFKVTSGPYCNGDTMTVFVQTSDGSQCLKTFSLRTGVIRSTVSV